MPFIQGTNPCKKCGSVHNEHRVRYNKQNNKHYTQSTCIPCERLETKKHQQENKDRWNEYNRKSYLNWSDEFKAKRLLQSNIRHQRLRNIPWDEELTNFVTEEAHHLRGMRDSLTGFKWHVDHVVPLNGKLVSGLHVWNNLEVIPATINLSKGNKCLHL